MDKELLKNSWVLAGLLLAITLVLGAIVFVIADFLKIIDSSIAGVMGIVGAIIVGQIYAMNFKESMPRTIKIKVVSIYIIAQLILAFLYISILDVSSLLLLGKILTNPVILFAGILIGIVLIVYSLAVYWALGFGTKQYLKTLH